MFVDSCTLCSQITWEKEIICKKCFHELSSRDFIFRKQGEAQVFSLFFYKDKVKDLILKCKQGNDPKLSEKLAFLLSHVLINKFHFDFDGVVPIPNSKGNLEDHAYLLGKTLSEKLEIPFYPHILESQNVGKSQKDRSVGERFETKFSRKSSQDKGGYGVWILVDDVITTGATLQEAHKTLGAAETLCLTLATRPYVLLNS